MSDIVDENIKESGNAGASVDGVNAGVGSGSGVGSGDDDMIGKDDTALPTQDDIIADLINQNVQLKKELDKITEIAKNTQSQYLNLKYDFDGYIKRIENEKKDIVGKSFVDAVGKFLPFIESLRHTVISVPADLSENMWSKGVLMVYENAVKTLDGYGISAITSVGESVNDSYHLAISTMEVDGEQKGKIIQELERGFVYKKDGIEIVVSKAKVIVGI